MSINLAAVFVRSSQARRRTDLTRSLSTRVVWTWKESYPTRKGARGTSPAASDEVGLGSALVVGYWEAEQRAERSGSRQFPACSGERQSRRIGLQPNGLQCLSDIPRPLANVRLAVVRRTDACNI
jgi:hypothetical protein